jgi:perosamine synthetase
LIPIFEPSLTNLERKYLLQAIDSGWISSQGPFITQLENHFAAWHDMPHAVACSNGTTALHLSLDALGIGPGDEVLCPDLTFIAPANMARLTGAKVVLVDVEPDSWGIDPKKMSEKITVRTKAVIVVHAFGHSADMDPILAVAREHHLKVIEDVAEAPGARYKGKLLGTLGDMSCFSFFGNKIITTGEGGMVMTRDAARDKALRIRRDHGMSREKKYVHEVVGFNYRMTNMQAAIGVAQLERFSDILRKRNSQAALYGQLLGVSNKVTWRPELSWCETVHWLATISLRHEELRDPLLEHLKEDGIDCRQMVFPVHCAPPYVAANDPAEFPVSRNVSLRSLHLPSGTDLPDSDVKRICEAVLAWVERHDNG